MPRSAPSPAAVPSASVPVFQQPSTKSISSWPLYRKLPAFRSNSCQFNHKVTKDTKNGGICVNSAEHRKSGHADCRCCDQHSHVLKVPACWKVFMSLAFATSFTREAS